MENLKPLTLKIVSYNNNNLGTWLHETKEGKEFYSLTLKSDDLVNISFALSPKHVYSDERKNIKEKTIGYQNIYIFEEWNYNINVFNKETKKAKIVPVTGKSLIAKIIKNIDGSTVSTPKPKPTKTKIDKEIDNLEF